MSITPPFSSVRLHLYRQVVRTKARAPALRFECHDGFHPKADDINFSPGIRDGTWTLTQKGPCVRHESCTISPTLGFRTVLLQTWRVRKRLRRLGRRSKNRSLRLCAIRRSSRLRADQCGQCCGFGAQNPVPKADGPPSFFPGLRFFASSQTTFWPAEQPDGLTGI